jgi:hypothetical protein
MPRTRGTARGNGVAQLRSLIAGEVSALVARGELHPLDAFPLANGEGLGAVLRYGLHLLVDRGERPPDSVLAALGEAL